MLPAFLLAVIGLTTPNPTSVGQEGRAARPPEGIVRVTRHPFLTGVGLWAVIHLIANGDAASFIFFGALAVTALAGTVSIDAKRRRALGPAQSFAAQTSIVPFAAIAAGRTRFNASDVAAWRWLAAIITYAGGHAHIFGVSPFSGMTGSPRRTHGRPGCLLARSCAASTTRQEASTLSAGAELRKGAGEAEARRFISVSDSFGR